MISRLSMFASSPNREKKSAVIVLMLAISMLAFAVWLKASPGLILGKRGEAAHLTKIWVDPTQGAGTKVKLAPADGLLFAFAPVPSRVQVRDWSWRSDTASELAAKALVTESQHWFRPPPLS